MRYCDSCQGWWPTIWRKVTGNDKLCIVHQMPDQRKVNMLLRGNVWLPSACIDENEAMLYLPAYPKLAYMLLKILNNVIIYDKEETPYKVKSYDLKNATLCEVNAAVDATRYYTMAQTPNQLYNEVHRKVLGPDLSVVNFDR